MTHSYQSRTVSTKRYRYCPTPDENLTKREKLLFYKTTKKWCRVMWEVRVFHFDYKYYNNKV